jgi:hypothetical protein
MKPTRWRRAGAQVLVLGAIAAAGFALAAEVRSSWLQSEVLSGFVRQLTFRLEPGPAPAVVLADGGPYDRRLGYAALPGMVERLGARGFVVTEQARLSERHRDLIGYGAFPI